MQIEPEQERLITILLYILPPNPLSYQAASPCTKQWIRKNGALLITLVSVQIWTTRRTVSKERQEISQETL